MSGKVYKLGISKQLNEGEEEQRQYKDDKSRKRREEKISMSPQTTQLRPQPRSSGIAARQAHIIQPREGLGLDGKFTNRFLKATIENEAATTEEERDLGRVENDTLLDEDMIFDNESNSPRSKKSKNTPSRGSTQGVKGEEMEEMAQGRLSGNRITIDEIYDDFRSGNLDKIRSQEPPYVPHMSNRELGMVVSSMNNRLSTKEIFANDPMAHFVRLVSAESGSDERQIGKAVVSDTRGFGSGSGGLSGASLNIPRGFSDQGNFQGNSNGITNRYFSPVGGPGPLGVGVGNTDERRNDSKRRVSLTPGFKSEDKPPRKISDIINTPVASAKKGRSTSGILNSEEGNDDDDDDNAQGNNYDDDEDPLNTRSGRDDIRIRREAAKDRDTLLSKALERDARNDSKQQYRGSSGGQMDIQRLLKDPEWAPRVKEWLSQQRMQANNQWIQRPEVTGTIELTSLTEGAMEFVRTELVMRYESLFGVSSEDLINNDVTRVAFARAVGNYINLIRVKATSRPKFNSDFIRCTTGYGMSLDKFVGITWDMRRRIFTRNGEELIDPGGICYRNKRRQVQDLDALPISSSGYALPKYTTEDQLALLSGRSAV
jgi:hypothetical protein